MPNSSASEPNAVPPEGMPTEDEVVSQQQVDVAVSAAVCSSADASPPQSPGAAKDTARSADSPRLEPVFASAGTKPRPETKTDLSSMFKSLSAKMMMKSERRSRFSDIAPAVSASCESPGAATVTENSSVAAGTATGMESGHSLHTSVDAGLSSTDTDAVRDNADGGILLPPYSRAVEKLPSAVGNRSETLTHGLQNYDVHEVTGVSLSLSCMPVFPPPPLPPTGIIAVTHGVPRVASFLPGL